VPLNRPGYLCGEVVRAHSSSDSHAKVGERIQGMPLPIEFSGSDFVQGKRARRGMVRDSVPAETKRDIEPDRQASMFIYELAISFLRPRSAAECNDARSLPVQNYLKGGSFSIAETRALATVVLPEPMKPTMTMRRSMMEPGRPGRPAP
jgi:hypothetical protein